MRTIEITVSATRKVNLGNYESKDFFAALKVEIESGDDTDRVLVALFRQAERAVEAAALEGVKRLSDTKDAGHQSWNVEHGVKNVSVA